MKLSSLGESAERRRVFSPSASGVVRPHCHTGDSQDTNSLPSIQSGSAEARRIRSINSPGASLPPLCHRLPVTLISLARCSVIESCAGCAIGMARTVPNATTYVLPHYMPHIVGQGVSLRLARSSPIFEERNTTEAKGSNQREELWAAPSDTDSE